MGRFLFLLLIMGVGFSSSSVKADPVAPNTTSNAVDITNEKPISSKRKDGLQGIPKGAPVGDFDSRPRVRDFRSDFGFPLHPQTPSGKMEPAQNINKMITGKVIGKPVSVPIKPEKRDPHTIGDFGPLPGTSYKAKNHNEDAVPPHPSDFGTVPIESGPDTRKAK